MANIKSNARKRAIITGVTGQIGSYLAEILLEKGYELYGCARNIDNLKNLKEANKIHLEAIDFKNLKAIEEYIVRVNPDEIYNLAAQSDAIVSRSDPEGTMQTNGEAVCAIINAVKSLKKPVKICQASSAQIYGLTNSATATELTNIKPENPYAVAKVLAQKALIKERENGMFCSNAILFNSESPRRGENFVTRKIAKGVAEVVKNKVDCIRLGTLDAKRDWTHAKDSANAMYLMLQAKNPGDYVVASGIVHSVREFTEIAFKYAGIKIKWRGEGVNEEGYDIETNKVVVRIDPQYFRPNETNILVGDASKARKELGWTPKIKFDKLVKEMVESELKH